MITLGRGTRRVFWSAGGSIAPRTMAPRSVASEQHDDNQQDQDGDDDPRDLHPPWCAGIVADVRG